MGDCGAGGGPHAVHLCACVNIMGFVVWIVDIPRTVR